MKFVRAIWKLLVGIKDALVLLLHDPVLRRPLRRAVGTARAGQGRRARPQSQRQRGRAAGAARNGPTSPAARASQQYRLRDLVAALDKAKDDSRVKAVALDLDGFSGGGATAIGDLADAVRRVRGAGKPVVAYGVGYTDDSYALASAASEIWLNPLGGVLIAGPGGSNLYYKGLLDKLGVTANVYRVGTYKSAVEPYIRNDMSPEAKQNYQALDQARLENWRAGGQAGAAKGEYRPVPHQHERRRCGRRRRHGQGCAAGRAGRQDRRPPRLRSAPGRARRRRRRPKASAFKQVKLGSYVADVVDRNPNGPIGIVTIAGMIVDGKAGPGTAGGDTIAERDRGRRPQQGHQGAGGAGRQPRRLGPRIRAHPPGAARGQGEEDPGRGVDGQRRRIRRLLGVDPGRLHLRRAVDHHRVDRRVRRHSELPGHTRKARRRRRRGEDDAAVGRAGPVKRAVARGQPADPDRRRIDVRPLPRHRRRSRATRRRNRSTRSRKAACGTAAPLTRSGWSTGSAASSEAIAKAAQLANLGDERGVRYLEPQQSFRDQMIEAFADSDNDTAVPTDAFSMLAAPAAAAARRRFARSPRDHGRTEHPGALPRMPGGCAGADRAEGFDVAWATEGMAQLSDGVSPSDVDGLTRHRHRRFLERLGMRRMGVAGVGNIF